MSFLGRIQASVTGVSEYHRILSVSGWQSTLIAVLLIAAFLPIFLGRAGGYMTQFTAQQTQWIRQNLPEFQIVNGKLAVNAQQPITHQWRLPGGQSLMLVVDTTGATTQEGMTQYPRWVLLTSESIITKDESGTQTLKYDERFPKDKNSLLEFMQGGVPVQVARFAASAAWLLIVPVWMLVLLFIALVAVAVTASTPRQVSFTEGWNVAVSAAIAPTVLLWIIWLFSRPIAHPLWLLPWLIAVVTWTVLGARRAVMTDGSTMQGIH